MAFRQRLLTVKFVAVRPKGVKFKRGSMVTVPLVQVIDCIQYLLNGQ